MASIRHKGRSIGEVTGRIVSPLTQKIFLVFLWLTLIYVLIVFLNLTPSTFAGNGGVASSSLMFIILAVLFGFWLYRLRLSALGGTLIFVPLTFLAIYLGHVLFFRNMSASSVLFWDLNFRSYLT